MSFVGGGANNVVTGNCSAILGGDNNNDGGLNNVHIAGSNITAVMDNAFHAEQYVGTSIPDGATSYGSLPIGAVYYLSTGTGVGKQALYIKCF